MDRAAARSKITRLARPHVVVEAPVLVLGDAIQMYGVMQSQLREMERQVHLLRERILTTLDEVGVDDIVVDGYQAVRQIRHRKPELNEEKAREILKRFGRLDECLETTLNEEKARRVIDSLQKQGKITRNELPYTELRDVDVLVIQKTDSNE